MDTSAIERIFTQSQLVANEAEASQLAKIAKENKESFISVVAKTKKIDFLDIKYVSKLIYFILFGISFKSSTMHTLIGYLELISLLIFSAFPIQSSL